jgi:PAS domain S-box-containing protein
MMANKIGRMKQSPVQPGSASPLQRGEQDHAAPAGVVESNAAFDPQPKGVLSFPTISSEMRSGREASPLPAAISRVAQLENELSATRLSLQLARLDLEALHQSESHLRKAEQSANAILEDVPPFLVLDQDLRVTMANHSFYSHFGVLSAQTINSRIYELGNRQWDIPQLRTLLEDVLPRNSFFNDFEISHTFPSIGRRTILLSGRRVDHLQRILLMIEDVTERLHFQSGMRRSEIRYRRLFEASRDGILILDPDTGKITDCNPFIQQLLDYPRPEILGKELWQIGLLKDGDASRKAFAQLREKGYIRYEDLPLESKTGRRLEVEFVSNLYVENGTSVIQCNIRDISTRKQAERALHAARDEISRHATELESHVAERTARLRETIGELEMFSYSVAHDMRAPLRAMAGFAHLLLEDFGSNLPPEAQGYVGYINDAAIRMDMLIQDVLTYTTILHSEIKISVVDLDTLVRQVIQSYPELHAADVQIEIQGLLPKVLGHPAAISQCLSNVLTNAVKFVAPGTKPLLQIRAADSHSHVRIWVKDNGIGIAAKDHKRIFGMFERVSNKYEGTGIGLAIVRKNLERLRGNVGLESALGEGSQFWLEFRKIR